MSKVGISLLTGVGGAGAALTTAYLAGAFNKSYDVNLYSTLTDFEKVDNKLNGCVLDLFPGLENKQGENLNDNGITTAYNGSFFEENKPISSCLVVNWEKYELPTDNTKGKGGFRFLWSVKEGNKGFVTFATASTKDESNQKKLAWEGAIYEIGHDTNGKGEKKNKHSISNKTVGSDQLEDYFPKAKNPLDGIGNKPFWGFMSTKEELNSACTTAEISTCTKESTSFKGYGEGTDNGGVSTTLGDGTSNLGTGGNSLFTNTKGDMSKVVANKKGTGHNKKIVDTPKAPVQVASQS